LGQAEQDIGHAHKQIQNYENQSRNYQPPYAAASAAPTAISWRRRAEIPTPTPAKRRLIRRAFLRLSI